MGHFREGTTGCRPSAVAGSFWGAQAPPVSFAFAFPLSAGTGDTITVEQFRALSARLTGASLGDLDMGAAAKLLAGFISMGVAADLARLAADPGASAGTLATDIVAAWYSGLYEARDGLASISLTNALLAGFCGGRIGYWADAPYG